MRITLDMLHTLWYTDPELRDCWAVKYFISQKGTVMGVICPEGGLPRLFRFDLDDDRILAELDEKQNLLRINKYLFDQLPFHLQTEVYKTSAKVLTVDHLM